MSLWRRLRALWGRGTEETHTFSLDQNLIQSLHELAAREQRPPQELAASLLHRALQEREQADLAWMLWHTLTPREQDVAALICLHYTTRQIAGRLGISPETVKTHAGNALEKFGVRRRVDLRALLAGWDFSAWEPADE